MGYRSRRRGGSLRSRQLRGHDADRRRFGSCVDRSRTHGRPLPAACRVDRRPRRTGRMNLVIDDHLLREVLLEQEPTWLRRMRRRGRLSTTGSWYYRLCSALHDSEFIGALSGPIAELPAPIRTAVVGRVVRPPPAIDMLSLRDVAWTAAGFGRRYGLNLLAAE